MTGFEPRISGVGSDRFTNYATTTAQSSHTLHWWSRAIAEQPPSSTFIFKEESFLVILFSK